jgi:hypothetical protein
MASNFISSIAGDVISSSVALVAIIVSVISFIRSSKFASLSDTQDNVREIYNDFAELNRLRFDNPLLSHLFELPVHYDRVSDMISKSFQNIDSKVATEYILKERALAILIFSAYEANLYNLAIAESQENREQKKFLTEVIGYMESCWLRNPRLVYFWGAEDHRLFEMFEKTTVQRYNHAVLNQIDTPLSDETGPTGRTAHAA